MGLWDLETTQGPEPLDNKSSDFVFFSLVAVLALEHNWIPMDKVIIEKPFWEKLEDLHWVPVLTKFLFRFRFVSILVEKKVANRIHVFKLLLSQCNLPPRLGIPPMSSKKVAATSWIWFAISWGHPFCKRHLSWGKMMLFLTTFLSRNSSDSLWFVLVSRGDPISASSPNSWHSSLSPWCSYPLSPSSSPRLMSYRRFFLEKIKIQYWSKHREHHPWPPGFWGQCSIPVDRLHNWNDR